MPSSPRRASSVERDAAELAAVDVRDAVVLGQPLVDERVVGRQQVEDVAVLAHDAGEEQLGLALKRLAQRVVEVGELVVVRVRWSAGCGSAATARRSSDQRVGAAGRRACGALRARAPPAD